jgi:hypothetical protein
MRQTRQTRLHAIDETIDSLCDAPVCGLTESMLSLYFDFSGAS